MAGEPIEKSYPFKLLYFISVLGLFMGWISLAVAGSHGCQKANLNDDHLSCDLLTHQVFFMIAVLATMVCEFTTLRELHISRALSKTSAESLRGRYAKVFGVQLFQLLTAAVALAAVQLCDETWNGGPSAPTLVQCSYSNTHTGVLIRESTAHSMEGLLVWNIFQIVRCSFR